MKPTYGSIQGCGTPLQRRSHLPSDESALRFICSRIKALFFAIRLWIFLIVSSQERRVSPQPVQQLIDSLTTKVEDLESETTTLESKNTTPHIDARKAVSKPIDPNIPREDVLHDIPPEEKSCGCGAELTRISEDVNEEIEIIPEQVLVKRHIYPRYACRVCEGSGDENKPVFRISRQNCRDRSSGFALRYDPVHVELDHRGSQKTECP